MKPVQKSILAECNKSRIFPEGKCGYRVVKAVKQNKLNID